MATFWEKAAHSVDHVFSLCLTICNISISRFSFEDLIWVLIASVPDLCKRSTISNKMNDIKALHESIIHRTRLERAFCNIIKCNIVHCISCRRYKIFY